MAKAAAAALSRGISAASCVASAHNENKHQRRKTWRKKAKISAAVCSINNGINNNNVTIGAKHQSGVSMKAKQSVAKWRERKSNGINNISVAKSAKAAS